MTTISDNQLTDLYTHNSQWKEFSNFYPSLIEYNGNIYPTGEHLFQSFKYLDRGDADADAYAEEIRLAKSPCDANTLGNRRCVPNRPNLRIRTNWDADRDEFMRITVNHKFANPVLCAILMSTGNKELVEHSVRDDYWGNGGGQNKLGQILMQYRDMIRQSGVMIDQ
jgi:ribA/ribD-fused uncharacterized protein